jgi:hypothetical protein
LHAYTHSIVRDECGTGGMSHVAVK